MRSWSRRRVSILVVVAVATLALIIGLTVALQPSSSKDTSSDFLDPDGNEIGVLVPSGRPFSSPSSSPSSSSSPSTTPSDEPSFSLYPSSLPSILPSMLPSEMPTTTPTASPTGPIYRTSFYAIADVPYSEEERGVLLTQISALNGSAVDFLIHLGDIKDGETDCTQEVIDELDEILKLAPVPVFLVVGDNEFNDCSNISPNRALRMWRDNFVRYDIKYWSHDFKNMTRSPDRPEIFAFVNEKTLFLGLNLVGGLVHDSDEWVDRHADQVAWVKDLMLQYQNEVHSVVVFGHFEPGDDTSEFFNPFIVFIRDDFPSNIPILYMCANAHAWSYKPQSFGIDNWLRVQLTGGEEEPVVRVTVDPDSFGSDPVNTFQVERFLNKSGS